MNKNELKRRVLERVLEKLEEQGLIHPASLVESAGGLAGYMSLGADDVAYLDASGKLVLESVGANGTEALRRLGMLIRELRVGAEGLGVELASDLSPTVFRLSESEGRGFRAVATFADRNYGQVVGRRVSEFAYKVQWTRNGRTKMTGKIGQPGKMRNKGTGNPFMYFILSEKSNGSWDALAVMYQSKGVDLGNHGSDLVAQTACEQWANRNLMDNESYLRRHGDESAKPYRSSEHVGMHVPERGLNQFGTGPVSGPVRAREGKDLFTC